MSTNENGSTPTSGNDESDYKIIDGIKYVKVSRVKMFISIAEQQAVQKARIDENESLLSVAEHEISLPDHCELHEKYAAQCYGCKKRKWYGEISKDWKRIIEQRLAALAADQARKDERIER